MPHFSLSHLKGKLKGKGIVAEASKNASLAASPSSSKATGTSGVTSGVPANVCHERDQNVRLLGSLWDKAYNVLKGRNEKLMEAFEKMLSSEPEFDKSANLEHRYGVERQKQMSELITKKLATMDQRQWRIKLSDDKSIVVREQIDQIVKIVLLVKDFGSSLASMDPLHAGLPWAGVCMLLPLVTNDTKQRSAAIDGLEYVSKLVRRYAEIEKIYLRTRADFDTQDLEASIIKLYSEVLEFEARAACQFNRNTAIQTVRNVVEADGWDSIIVTVKASEKACEKLTSIIDAQNHRQTGRQLKDILAKQDEKIEELLRMSREEDESNKKLLSKQQNWRQTDEERKCHQLLRNSNYEMHKNRNPDRVKETCKWFLEHPNFKQWFENEDSSLLWVSADPGCGNYYFFFKNDNPDQKSATKAICALLHQMFSQNSNLLKYALPEFRQNGSKLCDLFEPLWNILTTAIMDPEVGEVVCILDALDECEESGRFELIERLNHFYSKSAEHTRSETRLKFMVTSRPYIDIERGFKKLTRTFPTVHLAGDKETEQISREIEEVIKAKVQEFGFSLDLPTSVQTSLEKKLLSVTHRTYLWLKLIFDLIPKQVQVTEKRLMRVIDTLPDTVDKAYTAILDRITDLKRARKLLHIVVGAEQPLTVREMNVALAVEESSRSYEDLDLESEEKFYSTVKNLCGLFVSVIDSRIYLIHQTAGEFLIRDDSVIKSTGRVSHGQGIWKHSLDLAESNLILARICVSYLLFDVFESTPLVDESEIQLRGVRSTPFNEAEEREIVMRESNFRVSIQYGVDGYVSLHGLVKYSAMNWSCHFQKAAIHNDTPLSESALRLCDPRSMRYFAWFPVYWDSYDTCASGTEFPVYTHLMTASFLGLETLARLLVDRKIDVNARSQDHDDLTAVLLAAEKGHENVMELLLKSGADLEAQNSSQQTALQLAINGQASPKKIVAVVQVLLKNGINTEIRDGSGSTALICAAGRGNEAVLRLLLENNANINGTKNDKSTALHLASCNGHEGVVKLLLENGANVNAKDCEGNTALHRVVRSRNFDDGSGYPTVMKLLIENMADVNATNNDWETPLHTVADFGMNVAAKLLIENGADLEAMDERAYTPLHLASKFGRRSTVELLVERGANLQATSKFGKTVLHEATDDPYCKETMAVISFLLDKGVMIDAADAAGRTALYIALGAHEMTLAWLLLKRGANPNIRDARGMTALHWLASNYGDMDKCIRLLENAKAGIPLTGDSGNEALLEERMLQLANTVLDYGESDPCGALECQRKHGSDRCDTLELLLKYGADPEAKDQMGKTVLDVFYKSLRRSNRSESEDWDADSDTSWITSSCEEMGWNEENGDDRVEDAECKDEESENESHGGCSEHESR